MSDLDYQLWHYHTQDLRPALERLHVTHAMRVTGNWDRFRSSMNRTRIKLLVNPWRRNGEPLAANLLTPDQFYMLYVKFEHPFHVKFYSARGVLVWSTTLAELEADPDPWFRRTSFVGVGGTPFDVTHFLCYRLA
jgi:hypothetical protein